VKVDLAEKVSALKRPFEPKIVAYLNDYKVQVAKVHGEFVWHSHPETDDLLIEPRGTVNTGDAGGPLTAVEEEL
jgi:hypothetical protein